MLFIKDNVLTAGWFSPNVFSLIAKASFNKLAASLYLFWSLEKQTYQNSILNNDEIFVKVILIKINYIVSIKISNKNLFPWGSVFLKIFEYCTVIDNKLK